MFIKKEKIIEYFKSGIKNTKNFKIGVEHEKFLFNKNNNKRIDYLKIKEMFSALMEFGWNPVFEKENIVALNKGGRNITLEPGNQIELSGDKLNNMHEACAESQNYLFELKQVTKKLNMNIVSAGFDPISKLKEIPNNPKQRYKLMTNDMPLGGELSLDMMYRTCGTQLNIDYSSEEDFIKKFKVANSIVPISISLFANSSIVEKKNSNYLSYRSKVWQNTSRGGLPKLFFENLNFEKYAEFAMDFPILNAGPAHKQSQPQVSIDLSSIYFFNLFSVKIVLKCVVRSLSAGNRLLISEILPSIKSLKIYFFPEKYLSLS